jgi:predicted amidohydrolase
MDSSINIAIVQFSPIWNNKSKNFKKIASLLENLKADIIVLPELCTTGYSFLTNKEAFESADTSEEISTFFQKFSNKNKAVIVAGFAEKEKQEVYNCAIIVSPFQNHSVYRKTHLFYKEKNCFATGNSGFKVISHPNKDCKIGVMICYDWRFPESARTLALQGADIIVCPANLVTTVWEIGMKSRALENSVFVAVANRCQTEIRTLENNQKQELTFTGKSVLYNTLGAELIQANSENDTILTFSIDAKLARNKKFNEFNDIFEDRKPSHYKLD